MNRNAVKQCTAIAGRGVRQWKESCKRSPATALLSAMTAGFLAGMVLRIFGRRK